MKRASEFEIWISLNCFRSDLFLQHYDSVGDCWKLFRFNFTSVFVFYKFSAFGSRQTCSTRSNCFIQGFTDVGVKNANEPIIDRLKVLEYDVFEAMLRTAVSQQTHITIKTVNVLMIEVVINLGFDRKQETVCNSQMRERFGCCRSMRQFLKQYGFFVVRVGDVYLFFQVKNACDSNNCCCPATRCAHPLSKAISLHSLTPIGSYNREVEQPNCYKHADARSRYASDKAAVFPRYHSQFPRLDRIPISMKPMQFARAA